MAKIRITLKDPDGVYEDVYRNPELGEDDKEYLIRNYFEFSEYLTLEYDTVTKLLTIVKRPL